MDERDLRLALDDLADEVPVGAPPVRQVTADTRRTPWVPLAAAAAVVAVVGGGAVWLGGGADPDPVATEPRVSGSPSADPTAVADGARLMGIGHAAVEIPAGWGTNKTRCGTPMKDTVIVDEGVICLALFPRPEGIETIRLTVAQERPEFPDFAGAEQTTVAGVEAWVLPPTCTDQYGGLDDGAGGEEETVRVCATSTWLPSEEALFTSEAATKDEAVALLSTIRIVPDLTALPGPNAFSAREGNGNDQGPSKAGLAYLEAVRATGAEVTVEEKPMPAITPGTVLDVSPYPGTMLAPGDEVTVTVVAPQDTLAERVSVGLGWDGGGDDQSFDDAEFRADPTLRVKVGTPVWAYYQKSAPVKRGDVTEEMTGDALRADHRNGPLWSYVAERPGTSTYTLSVGGEVIGTVTIVVE